jgi:hypothetical protein
LRADGGAKPPVATALLFSATTFNKTIPTSVICGVTSIAKARKRIRSSQPMFRLHRCRRLMVVTGICEPLRLPLTVIQSRNARRGDGFRLTFRFSSGIKALICAEPKMPVVKP